MGSRGEQFGPEGLGEEEEQQEVSGNGLEKQVTRFAGGFDTEDR